MEQFKSRRLRIVEPGLDNYTGLFGLVEFVDGVSVDFVTWREAHVLGSNVRIVDADSDTYQVGPVADLDRMWDTTADAAIVSAVDRGIQVNGEIVPATDYYTRADLEKMADAGGLAAVRSLANARGKTGRSITQCIDAILEAQGDNPTQTTEPGPGE